MIWLPILLLTALVLLPCVLALRARPGLRDRHEAAMQLHRAQLQELDRDRADGLIADSEHASARLEIQRRLLAEADRGDDTTRAGGRAPVLAVLALVPVAAVVLYLSEGHPGMPAQPASLRMSEANARLREDAHLIDMLKAQLAKLPAGAAATRQGYILLGQAEATQGDWASAAVAWRQALHDGPFEPTLAAQTAEAQARGDGVVSAETAALFRQALDAAPKDASWRLLAEQRIAQSEHH
nr:c-type cytochrome biogenesis protein CcmI [uncultured Lichenicoccus sp.]